MNNDINENKDFNGAIRPFGYWITAVDRLLRAELATVFDDEGISRRDWRLLNRIAGTASPDGRPLNGRKLRRLTNLGWVERGAEGWMLTESGARAKERLTAAVGEIRARVAGAVSAEDFDAVMASLEKIARELGWEEGRRLPRRPRRGHGRHDGRGHGDHGHGGHGYGDRRHGLSGHDRAGRAQCFGERGHHGHRGHGGRRPSATHIHFHTHH